MAVDVPYEYGSTDKFQGTLGHKVNHNFEYNSMFTPIETARFGIILSIKSKKPIKKNQECFVHYGYTLGKGPKWYKALHKKYTASRLKVKETKGLEIKLTRNSD